MPPADAGRAAVQPPDASRAAGAPGFVAGATGYVGREVVRALAARGVPAVAHVRPESPRLAEWRARFAAVPATVDATPWDEAALTATLARLRPAAVFALLGTTRARAAEAAAHGRDEGYEAVDYGLTALLLRAARAAAASTGVAPRVVYLSAAGVREGTRNPYLQARARVERELRESGLPWTIVRPAFITGPDRDERRPLERVGAVVTDAALDLAGALGARALRARWRSITGTELGTALARVAFDPHADGRVLTGEALRG
jgi:uncharacterized protein YbjT (DUF2867 family)